MANPKGSRLGRGIDALIPSDSITDPQHNSNPIKNEKAKTKTVEVVKEVVKEVIKEVPADTILKLSQIEPNREQPRKQFNQDSLEELAASIKEHGLIQPIVVQKKNGYYEIVAGERRWRAAKLAGLKEVPVIIKEYTEKELTEIALIENIQREDLNPIEEAKAFKNLIESYNLTHDEVAKKVSKKRETISNSLRLLKLCDDVQQLLISGVENFSAGHARALISVEDPALQLALAKQIVDKNLSVRATERLVKTVLTSSDREPVYAPKEDGIYKKIEENLRSIMGSKVSINRKAGNKGKIEIEYYSGEDLERIIELFNSIKTT